MKYQIQELNYTNDKIISKIPSPVEKTETRIAILIHVFYLDIWQEIQTYLANIQTPYDLYITVPQGTHEEDIIDIFKKTPDIHIYMTENRGRDVLPFLQVMQIIGTDTYEYICKLHTKKTADSAVGNVWRQLLYFDLLGSNETVNNIVDLFENQTDIGMITGKNTILDSETYMYDNRPKIELLKRELHIDSNTSYPFAAGTMFWVRPKLLTNLIALFQEEKLNFEDEMGQTDNTLAHAIERLFGLLCQESTLYIAQSPASYTKLSSTLLNDMTKLVLSQEYIDKTYISKLENTIEYFEKQSNDHEIHIENLNTEIEKLNNYKKELEALAESMRIKNRLKRLVPQNIMQKVTKLIGILRTIKNNPLLLKKVFYYLKRGEFSYLWSKAKEKSKNNISGARELKGITPSSYFKSFDITDYALGNITIDIIIPVYNGYEFLEPLFDSLEANTFSAHRLIVINDCSPDERVKPLLLKRLEKYPTSIFIDHTENQGFLKSVNEAYTYTSNHFLILNTDTEVPKYWIERLMYPIIHMDNIASTTPFTNSGEIASFPNFVADNEIFEGMSVDTLDEVFREVNPKDFYAQVPTGVGFCMGINYTLTKTLGMFVEDTFGKGYGEENDWCQRAIKEGYKNLIVPNLFVYHKHGGSFTVEEKQKLLKENATKLLDRHPNYSKDVSTYIQEDPHNHLRHILSLIASSKTKAIEIMFDHDLGGGANIYANERIEHYLKEEKNTLLIKFDFYSNVFKVYHKYKTYNVAFSLASFEQLILLLEKLEIKEIFLNSLVSYKGIYNILEYLNKLVEVKEIHLTIPIHDFNPICPNYTLLSGKGIHCQDLSLEGCQKCIENNDLEWKSLVPDKINLPLWRALWLKLLEKSNSILCFSNSSKEILLSAYPTLPTDNIEVIPHTVEPLPPIQVQKDSNTKKITVGVLGAINYSKGLYILKEMTHIIEKEHLDIDIVVIGEVSEAINSKHFKVTGRYKRDNLPKIIQDNQIDIFLIPSIWPETFSYTTQEIMMMEMPLMVFNLGAPAERVTHYSKGYIMDKVNSEAVFETLQEYIINKKNDA